MRAKLNFYNKKQNILTCCFSLEYFLHFNTISPVSIFLNLPIPLGGSSNYFKISCLNALGNWDIYNVTRREVRPHININNIGIIR